MSVKLAVEKVAFGCLVELFSQESITIDYRIEILTEPIDFERKAIHQHYSKGASLSGFQAIFSSCQRFDLLKTKVVVS